MAVYLTPAQMLAYYDSRRLCDMLSDTGTAVDPSALATNDRLLTLIRAASGELDSALQVGRRYQRQNIEELIDAATAAESDPPSAARERVLTRASVIREIVADLTWGKLMAVRGYSAADMTSLAPKVLQTQKKVEDLASGIAVLDLNANIDAGVPHVVKIGSKRPSIYGHIRMFPRDCYPDQSGYHGYSGYY